MEEERYKLKTVIGIMLILIGFSIISHYIYNIAIREYEQRRLLKNFYKEYELSKNNFNDKNINEILDSKDNNYENILIDKEVNLENNVKEEKYVAVLEIPLIKLKKGLYKKDSVKNNINQNIEILKKSSMPNILNGNFILASHSGNTNVAYFKNIYKLNSDDEISVYYEKKQYKYKIVNKYEVLKTGKVHLIRNANKNTITLITCKKNSDKQIIIIGELEKIV